MTKYRLTIDYDQDCEKPEDAFKIVSFSNRHYGYKHPETYMERDCPTCNGYGCIDGDYTKECPKCEGVGTEPCRIEDHPDVLAVLSYYEHGQCKWMVGDSTVPDYGGFDTANVAGVIVHNEDFDPDLSWFTEKTDEEKTKTLDAVAEEYTAWANGDCYGYSLDELETCDSCGNVEVGEHIDSCWGYIGDGYFSDYINSEVLYGIDPADVTLAGEAAYIVTLDKVQVDAIV